MRSEEFTNTQESYSFCICNFISYKQDILQNKQTRLWSQALRITREQSRQTNVRQTQEEHDNTIQTKTTSRVWRTTLSESIQVILKTFRLGVNTFLDHALFQLLDVVDTLSSGHNLFTTHEEII